MEHSKILHVIIAIMSLYLFIVFAFWWLKYKQATTLYGITCFLMLGIFFTHAGAYWLYYNSIDGEIFLEAFHSWYWPIRQYFMLIPISFYVVHVTKKLIKNQKDD